MQTNNNIDNRFPWSFTGAILGLIGVALALFFYYLSQKEDETNLRFLIEDEFPLVELKEQFSGIKVVYEDEDILGAAKQIKIIRIRLDNEGRTILQGYFDQNLPFGLKFHNSSILASEIVSASTPYIQTNLLQESRVPQDLAAGFLLLNKLILEKGSQATLKVYLLQEKGIVSSSISSLGKISGMDAIKVLSVNLDDADAGAFGGNLEDVLVLALAGGYLGTFLLIVSIGVVSGLHSVISSRRRKRFCDGFLEQGRELNDAEREIVQSFGRGWPTYYLPTIRHLARTTDCAMDLSELVLHQIGNTKTAAVRILLDFRLLPSLKRLLPLKWDPAVFTLTERRIAVNEANKQLIFRLLGEYGAL